MQKKGNLYQEISAITNDETFITKCKTMGIITLEDIIKKGPAEIRKDPGFNMLWYTTLLQILQQQNILEDYEKLF
jgi:hypothetical protein